MAWYFGGLMPAYTLIGCSTKRRSLFYGAIHKTPSWNMLALWNTNLGRSLAVQKWKSWAEAVQPRASMSIYSSSVRCIRISISSHVVFVGNDKQEKEEEERWGAVLKQSLESK